MSHQRIHYLLEQQVNQQLTIAERDELLALFGSEQDAVLKAIAEKIDTEGKTPLDIDAGTLKASFDKVITADRIEISPTYPIVHRVHFLRRWRWAAAVILLMAGSGAIWLTTRDHSTAPVPLLAAKQPIQPGKEGAILTLADGRQVSLDTVTQGTVALQGGVSARVENGTLTYTGNAKERLYNTMSTPKGRQFHVLLPDGTQVWLNAASSIRYPTVFSDNERTVEITGEVYFEATANPHQPFRVIVNNKETVEVLGTHFNINAYDNEQAIATTLLAGSVRISSGKEQKILKPGQQARIKQTGTNTPGQEQTGITVNNDADIDKVIAWKKGIFDFDNSTLEESMRQLERWYDIDVQYTQGVPSIELTGKMSKNITLNDLLEVLEKVGVHYKLQGRTLLVAP